MVRLFEVSPLIWETTVEDLEKQLKDIDFKSKDVTPDWRKLAHRRKVDRELSEKYGYFRDVILNPRFQSVKHYLDENANFSFLLGDPIMPWTTAIIILYMLNRRIKTSIVALAAAFIFNINPLYVSLAVFLSWLYSKRRSSVKAFQAQSNSVQQLSNNQNNKNTNSNKGRTNSPSRRSANSSAVSKASKGPQKETYSKPAKSSEEPNLTSRKSKSHFVRSYETGIFGPNDEDLSAEFDTILLGNDLATLYCAALLSKVGARCCVLQADNVSSSSVSAL
jgi:hypothetical protein